MSAVLPKPLYNAAQVRELDRLAIEQRGIPGIVLMKRAARAVYHKLSEYWPAEPLTVFCGAGNNGGDGYLVAALAMAQQRQVQVVQLVAPEKLSGDALQAYDYAQQMAVPMQRFADDFQLSSGVVVDAMLGTGLKGELRTPYDQAIGLINQSGLPVVAVDIPSGLDADSGASQGRVIEAAVTVSFIGLKQGLFTGLGPQVCGEVVYDDLKVPPDIFAEVPCRAQLIDAADFKPLLGLRSRNSHKGAFGHVLVIGGDNGFGGAVAMAAEAALRVGAGLVSVATRAEHIAPLLARRPELMVKAVANARELTPLLEAATVVVIGPGLGQSSWSQQLLQGVLSCDLPVVVDADGLNLLAQQPVTSKPNWLLTPHPGEAGRLLGIPTNEVQADRFAALTALRIKYGCPVMLKGSGSLVFDVAANTIKVCEAGNPGMASGGMGDVLSGVVAGLVAQGLPVDDALAAGVCLHAEAADIAAANGERGLLATDLFSPLRQLVNPC